MASEIMKKSKRKVCTKLLNPALRHEKLFKVTRPTTTHPETSKSYFTEADNPNKKKKRIKYNPQANVYKPRSIYVDIKCVKLNPLEKLNSLEEILVEQVEP